MSKRNFEKRQQVSANNFSEQKIEPTKGIVTGCSKLNLRAEATTDSEALLILSEGTKVLLTNDNPNSEWIGVRYGAAIGFCMSKFIKTIA